MAGILQHTGERAPWIWLFAVLAVLQASACSSGDGAAQKAENPRPSASTPAPAAGQPGARKTGEFSLGGVPEAPVKIEVFSDYQCPVCRIFYIETLKPVLAEYAASKQVYIVYHDFPLDMHPYARKAARFAHAAFQIGRDRWLRVTDALYAQQAQWSLDGNIEAVLARVLDPADLARIARLAADPATVAAVDNGILLGRSRSITVTPTFFITTTDGRQERVNQGVPYAVLKDYLDRILKK
ncbi:MAG: oxidoreductase [Acidobacteria bacterium]|nr:oxidoreductase [Acidobacteriota bacterium]